MARIELHLTPLHGRVLDYVGARIVASVSDVARELEVDEDDVERVCCDLVRAGLLVAVSEN